MRCSRREILSLLKEYLLAVPSDESSTIWLSMGDFDNLKEVNSLFGKTVVDVSLSFSYGIIGDVLSDFCRKHMLHSVAHSFSGDELMVLFPPLRLSPREVRGLLDEIRKQIAHHFEKGYFVACLTNFNQVFFRLPSRRLFEIKDSLAAQRIYVDMVPRSRGHLFMAPLRFSGEKPAIALRRVLRTINRLVEPELGEQLSASLEWIYHKEAGSYKPFNGGFIWPMTMSFGAVSHRELLQKRDASPFGEMDGEMFLSAQAALQESKKQGNVTTLGAGRWTASAGPVRDEKREIMDFHIRKPYVQARAHYKIMGEHRLRESVYYLSRGDNNGTLVHIAPLYGVEARQDRAIGLKELNDRFGYEAGDRVISLLESLLMNEVRKFCSSSGIARKSVLVSRFVDTFKIYVHSAPLRYSRLTQMMKRLVDEFNSSSGKVSMESLTVSLVPNRERIPGNILFSRLEYTIMSREVAGILAREGRLLVKEYAPGVESEGEAMIEEGACLAARALLKRKRAHRTTA